MAHPPNEKEQKKDKQKKLSIVIDNKRHESLKGEAKEIKESSQNVNCSVNHCLISACLIGYFSTEQGEIII